MADIDFYADEFWVLPMYGDKIYQIDENGAIIDQVKLICNGNVFLASEFIRIVVQEKYLFLLSYQRQGIYVYDKIKKGIVIIGDKNCLLPETYRTNSVGYWGYYILDNNICFLPWQYKGLEVNLDTLEYKYRDMPYPASWTDKEYKYRYYWNLFFNQDFLFMETDKKSFDTFSEYIINDEAGMLIESIGNTGKKIWSVI